MHAPSPRLHVDLTTAFEEAGRIAHGTVRVERELVGALAEIGGQHIAFCRFDRQARRYVELSSAEARDIVRAPTLPEGRREPRPSWRTHPLLQAGRRLERWIRVNVRDRFRRQRGDLVRRLITPAEIFPEGGWLLAPGELQRQDFPLLMQLRRSLDLHLAFVFYDLLGTLTAEDPRARDPRAADVPSTEFIMREASLIMPISHFSARELGRHAVERGIRLPPMHVIRLGHRISERADAAGGAASRELAPGGFVISVGDVVPRKNHGLLVAVWSELARERAGRVPPLVIVGRVGAEGAALVASVRDDPVAARVVRFMSNADDATLQWLYENCRFTLFPSLSEGFGLPVVESLAAGKPCIASNATAIPEASQGAAIHLDPGDRAAWRAAIARLIDDDAALAQAANDIRARFRPIGWSETAADVLDAIAEARSRTASG